MLIVKDTAVAASRIYSLRVFDEGLMNWHNISSQLCLGINIIKVPLDFLPLYSILFIEW